MSWLLHSTGPAMALVLALAVAAGLLMAWGAWPRRVTGGRGRGADETHLVAYSSSASSVRLATFNIHGGRGNDGRRDLSRAVRDLAGIDLAALQEVHDTWRDPAQYRDLAARLGLAQLYAPARRRWFRPHRGNALLTRYPVGDWTRLCLHHDSRQRYHFRNLTIAEVRLPGPVRVLFTHLNRRDGQTEQLEEVMREFLAGSPAVLMGDFNMRRDHPSLQTYLVREDVTDALHETLEEDDPDRIDWILCRGLTPLRGGVIDSGASDHPLYWCDLTLDRG